ncbi:uncharacterized protein BX664DRAFT_327042, partial [Halteromyces radiatus]|uniref:uncharacterized protein n=1 Tax=Halteromyces radiatus TaxID=101107 RepID=UPI00221EF37F
MSSIKERALANINRLFKITDSKQLEQLSKKVSISTQDITRLKVDAIVNAANNSLLGGGGVDGAIHRAAGPGLLKECKTLNGCDTGDAKITKGYNLPASHVIATVGPIAPPEQPDVLASCYRRSLQVLVSNRLRTIAFPCISTGVYGFNKERAANIALGTVRQFLVSNDGDSVDQVIFCLFNPEDIKIYQELLPLYFPSTSS